MRSTIDAAHGSRRHEKAYITRASVHRTIRNGASRGNRRRSALPATAATLAIAATLGIALGSCGPPDVGDGQITLRAEPPGRPAESLQVNQALATPESDPSAGVLAVREGESRSPVQQTYTIEVALHDAAVGGDAGARISERMDGEADRLASDLTGLEVERVAEGIKIVLDIGILFDDGSDDLAPAAIDYLSRLAERLAEFHEADVLIVGHTDRSGSSDENLQLSAQRAESAVEFLASQGIDRSRLSHLGRGELEPLATENADGENARRLNRRVEIAIFASDRMEPEAGAGAVPVGDP